MELSNKRSSDDNKPWWVDFIYRVGVTAAVAIYLIWWVTAKVDLKQDSTLDLMQAQTTLLEKHKDESQDTANELKRSNQFLQQICFSTTPERRRTDCFK